MFNPAGFSCHVEAGSELGGATEAEPVEAEHHTVEVERQENDVHTAIRRISESGIRARKDKLCENVGKPELLTPEQTDQLHQFWGLHHDDFSLDPHE